MIMHDYHKEGKKAVLLLHPMLASGEMMYTLLGSRLGEDVRCLAPDFCSHGEQSGEEFPGASVEADRIAAYLNENGITHLDLVYGASLGGVVLTELLKRNISFTTAFFEGTSFFEGARLLTSILGSKFIKKHRRAAADRPRAIQAMTALYGPQFAEAFADQFIAMSEESIQKIAETCGDNVHADLLPEQQRRCVFAYGSKDPNTLKAKGRCKKYYPQARYVVWNGYGHCEKITADPDAYAAMLRSYLDA